VGLEILYAKNFARSNGCPEWSVGVGVKIRTKNVAQRLGGMRSDAKDLVQLLRLCFALKRLADSFTAHGVDGVDVVVGNFHVFALSRPGGSNASLAHREDNIFKMVLQ